MMFRKLTVAMTAVLASTLVLHAQMQLPEPSDTKAGLPLNHTEFRGVDTDGNGFENIVVGVTGYDEVDPQLGEVHILSTSNPTHNIVIYGEQLNDAFGFTSIGIPDVTGNGRNDVLVTALNWSTGSDAVGRVYVFRGSDGQHVHTFQGADANAFFGYAVAAIGDITGDGIPEIAVGAPHTGAYREGRVYIYNGATGALVTQIDGTERNGLFGWSLSTAGDINGDGFADFIVGAPGGDLQSLGHAYVFSGLTQSLLRRIAGRDIGGRLGSAVAGGYDVTGHGQFDVVIGAPGAANSGPGSDPDPESHGRVYVFLASTLLASGGDLSVTSADLLICPSHAEDTEFGSKIAIGNDVDDDIISDLIIVSFHEQSLPNGDPRMRVNVVSAFNGDVIQTYTFDEDAEDSVIHIPASDGGGAAICSVCWQACDCFNDAVRKYNIKIRGVNRRNRQWVGCAAICGLSLPACALVS